jgi:fatty acid desaturase
MRTLPILTDPEFTQPEKYSAFDSFWLKLIRDERDLPFIHLTLQITFVLTTLGALMYMPFIQGWLWWVVAAAYFYFNNMVFKGPFGLMLHCTSHRPWFIQKLKLANYYLPWYVGLFFGQTPETYACHHIGMHHRENNLEGDLSSTIHYQRDSLKDFMKYFLNFFIWGVIPLVFYFRQRKQYNLSWKVIRGEVFFIVMCVGLCFVNWAATFMVFILPFLLSRLIMMMGNWAQHSFVDAADPGNEYKNSITCINSKYNKKCWNDGYHISHHIRPAMHWTEHPAHLRNNVKEYVANKALVFEGIEFLSVWKSLMAKKYDFLADHLVNFDGLFKNREEAIEVMKQRTTKIPAPVTI